MAFKLKMILTLLVLILLIQNGLTKPLPKQPDANEDEDLINVIKRHNDKEEEQLSLKNALVLYTLKQMSQLTDYFKETSAQLVKSALEDENVVSNANADVTEFRNDLHNYLDVVKKSSTLEDRCNVVNAFFKIARKYDTDDMDTATQKQKAFAPILNKHGWEQFYEDFGKKILDILNGIVEKHFIKTLNDKDTKNIEKYTTFLEVLKTKESTEDKLQYVLDYMDKESGENNE